MRVEIILNCHAGALIGVQHDRIMSAIKAAFEQHHQTEVACVDPADIVPRIKECLSRSVDVIVVGGGDGTVRTAAELVVGTPVALGILPLGTLNRMARDLAIPFGIVDAAKALANGEISLVDVGYVNDRIFVCNSLLGFPADYAEVRQRMRGQPLFKRVVGYVRVARDLLLSTRQIAIRVEHNKSKMLLRALTVIVSNNAYAEKPTIWLRRAAINRGELAVYVARHRAGWRMVGSVLRAMLGQWRFDPAVEEITESTIVLSARALTLKVSNDGELEHLRTPLEYRIRPRSLRVLMPATFLK